MIGSLIEQKTHMVISPTSRTQKKILQLTYKSTFIHSDHNLKDAILMNLFPKKFIYTDVHSFTAMPTLHKSHSFKVKNIASFNSSKKEKYFLKRLLFININQIFNLKHISISHQNNENP
jgi:hypothetical protein